MLRTLYKTLEYYIEELFSGHLLKRLVIAWKRHGTRNFIYLIGKNLKYYTEELFSGRLLQSANKSKFDNEFGTDTDGIRPIGSLDIALAENSLHAFSYEASPYHVITEIFQKLSNIAHTRFSFIDFGAGKGRVLFIASLLPFKAVIGIEFSPELCEIAKSNIAKIPPSECVAASIECVQADAMKYRLPGDPLVCYFHNPFDQVIMEAVIGRLVESLREIPRELYVVYLNPKYRMLFDNSRLWDVISENDPDAIWQMEDFVIYRFCHQYNFKSTQMHTEAEAEAEAEAVI